MSEIITYTLREGHRHSDAYYQEIDRFALEVVAEAERRGGDRLKAFKRFLLESAREPLRSDAEYWFEWLTLGVLWRVYGHEAHSLGRPSRSLLSGLSELRQRASWLKPALDPVRGILARLFLKPGRRIREPMPPASLGNLDRLLGWLVATGDFSEEVKRLEAWRDFLAAQSTSGRRALLSHAIEFAGWFERESLTRLGRYTPEVERFLSEKLGPYRWREDGIFCSRQRVEYHMNMVGTAVMNQAFRHGFLETRQKVVLLPPCMKAKADGGCEATMTPYGERCAACTPGCRVHQVTKLGEKHGFEVFTLPHELSVFSGGQVKPKDGGHVGIVGVSCPLTNVTGGWETRALGVPAQGVLLDYCGCSWHWRLGSGIMTDINMRQLLRTLGIEERRPRRAGAPPVLSSQSYGAEAG